MRRLAFVLSCLLAVASCGGAPAAPVTEPRAAHGASSARSACADADIAVQILGSGGPIPEDGRASSGYLLWVRGRARLLIDVGTGVMLRLGESGADLADLDAVLLSHLHVDHSADLPGLLKRMHFAGARRPLHVLGPRAGGDFPGLEGFLRALFAEDGVYRYLGYLRDGARFPIALREVDVSTAAPEEVLQLSDLSVRAIGVPHGPVPALAYSITVEGRRIAFMGDQRADEARYLELIRGANLLVAHMAVGPAPDEVASRLHANPARLGEVAREADVGTMVLSHLMGRSLEGLDANLSAIRARYAGRVIVAEDGLCVPVP